MNYLEKYGYVPDDEEIGRAIELIAQNVGTSVSNETLLNCFSMMDLTSLKSEDTVASIEKLVDKVNDFQTIYPDYPLPASICVYSNFASTVVARRNNPDVHATVVSACFPTSQSFPEVKLLECQMAVEAGADEVDIVLALNKFLAGDKAGAFKEIAAVRKAINKAAGKRKVILKVILETGLLVSTSNIAEASFLAMEAGADFIKTSTGKVNVNATPTAAYVMCQCIDKYYKATGRKVGFKPAGGMSTAQDAIGYYAIVAAVLGEEWLNKSLFRFGVSRMANNLLSTIEQKTVSFF